MKINNNSSILITGGTGSFGKNFVHQLLKRYPKIRRLVIFSRDEFKQYEMSKMFSQKKYPGIRFFLGDIRDYQRLKTSFRNIDIVVHAAALKQVDTAEYNPIEFVNTNIIGAKNIIMAAMDEQVKKVVALSTDKAVSPVNLYGATKLCSDKLFLAANNYVGKKNCKFSIVRYGNVIGSRGSVLKVFMDNKDKGYFPITDKDMTRFFLDISIGIKAVNYTINNMLGGEVVIPKVPSIRIVDLAKAINPKNKLKLIGIREGEKIHEDMITSADNRNCYENKDYLFLINLNDNYKKLIKNYNLKKTKKGFIYNSKTNIKFLKIQEIKSVIKYLNKNLFI